MSKFFARLFDKPVINSKYAWFNKYVEQLIGRRKVENGGKVSVKCLLCNYCSDVTERGYVTCGSKSACCYRPVRDYLPADYTAAK